MGRKMLELTNMRFGNWNVLGFAYQNKGKGSMWNCICDCGTKRIVCGGDLKNGETKSCGCLSHKNEHGLTKKSVYYIWSGMIQRCTNQKDINYHNYGGRGIHVCERWLNFKNFYKDMGDRLKGTSIDRIDVNGNYCKENCRWATIEVQCNNKRNSKYRIYNGKKMTNAQVANELVKHSALSRKLIYDRLYKGCSIEESLNTDLSHGKKYSYNHSER